MNQGAAQNPPRVSASSEDTNTTTTGGPRSTPPSSEPSSTRSSFPSHDDGHDVPSTIDVSSAAAVKNTKKSSPPAKASQPDKKKPRGMPRRPQSAYSFYCQAESIRWWNAQRENRSSNNGNNNNNSEGSQWEGHTISSAEELAAVISAKWKTLNGEEREPYEALADRDLNRYHQEMQAHSLRLLRNRRAAAAAASEAAGSAEVYSSLSGSSSSNPSSSDTSGTVEDSRAQLPSLPVADGEVTLPSNPPLAAHLLPHNQQHLLCSVLLNTLSPGQVQELQGLLRQWEQVVSLMIRLQEHEQQDSTGAVRSSP